MRGIKDPHICDHSDLDDSIAGGARRCKDCASILTVYHQGTLERAQIAESRVEELEGFLKFWIHSTEWATEFQMWMESRK
jgi:hypothetical protein